MTGILLTITIGFAVVVCAGGLLLSIVAFRDTRRRWGQFVGGQEDDL